MYTGGEAIQQPVTGLTGRIGKGGQAIKAVPDASGRHSMAPVLVLVRCAP